MLWSGLIGFSFVLLVGPTPYMALKNDRDYAPLGLIPAAPIEKDHVFEQHPLDDFICKWCHRPRLMHENDGFKPTTKKTLHDFIAEELCQQEPPAHQEM